ncbi:hypothetical protein GCM10007423_50060 [Dyadobacter endophyticus]|uniref:histidine kinase n=1 Tax=Dyadobacter endophyticus TaxID=1749036 RepID=A0ABQ1Z495_9BACT|nr:sensor histidine kinase [Dyadobacter endophyticus]GGH48676.1 hypothetical protein GCM10007423_50060 [Dyadobacter endophyticus]
MISYNDSDGSSVGHLTLFLAERQHDLLDNWRTACGNDFSLKGAESLSREQFINQVPAMLNVLGQRLNGEADREDFRLLTAGHGLHRWQKGYDLSDLSAEMHHLNRLLLGELRAFWKLNPSTNASLAFSYEHLAEFSNEINTGSITQYADLQRQAALNRAEALQKTLAELNEIGKQRSDLLRNSFHDLRGSFTALQGAASLLEMVNNSDQERKELLEILRRNLVNCRTLVTQLMDLARLEAGQEVLQIKCIDAAQMLTDLVSRYQPLANDRGLILNCEGPASLLVECDPIHLQRIVQNLVLNALKHTESGWVSVGWTLGNDNCWTISVQDSGPGLPNAIQNDFFAQTDDSSLHPMENVNMTADDSCHQEMLLTPSPQTAFSHKGEGIGLSIVKGLCELLRAGLSIESRRGEGTTFRIKLATYWQN